MKNVAKEVKLIQHRTRLALPGVELRNRAKRAQVLSPQPLVDAKKLVHKTELPLPSAPRV